MTPAERRRRALSEERYTKWEKEVRNWSHDDLMSAVQSYPFQTHCGRDLFLVFDGGLCAPDLFFWCPCDDYPVRLADKVVEWLWDNKILFRFHYPLYIADWLEDPEFSVVAAGVEFTRGADLVAFKFRWG